MVYHDFLYEIATYQSPGAHSAAAVGAPHGPIALLDQQSGRPGCRWPGRGENSGISQGKRPIEYMIYLLKMVIFHGYVVK